MEGLRDAHICDLPDDLLHIYSSAVHWRPGEQAGYSSGTRSSQAAIGKLSLDAAVGSRSTPRSANIGTAFHERQSGTTTSSIWTKYRLLAACLYREWLPGSRSTQAISRSSPSNLMRTSVGTKTGPNFGNGKRRESLSTRCSACWLPCQKRPW